MSENDCILFIDETMAKTLIACRRAKTQETDVIAKITGQAKGQVADQLSQAVAVGAIDRKNNISEMAEKCINAIIKKRVDELK
jgi:hypothetical protein